MLCRFSAARRGIAPHSTSISRKSLILLHPLLLEAFVYSDHGLAEKVTFVARVLAPVFNWNETCFLNRSSDVGKEHVQLLLRAGWGGAGAAQEPSVLP